MGAFGGLTSSDASTFQARLSNLTDGVSNTLTLLPYKGNQVAIAGGLVTIADAGLAVLVSANLISSTGADSGGAPAASTLYYCYVSNAAASFAASGIRLSATSPSMVSQVKYLGTSGNALNWRFVGFVRTNATPQFESNPAARLIVNYYNRVPLQLLVCPGYANDNASATYTLANNTWDGVKAGTGDFVRWIGNGEDAASFSAAMTALPAAVDQVALGIGIDTKATSKVSEFSPSLTTVVYSELAASWVEPAPTAVAHQAYLLGVSAGGGTATVVADDVRRGGTTDPVTTYLAGVIQG